MQQQQTSPSGNLRHPDLITNTVFRLPNRNKTSWEHPCSKHWHILNSVIVRQRDRRDVRVTKTMCGAECWTDHRLLISKMTLQELENKLQPPNTEPNADVETEWARLRDAIYTATSSVVGSTTRKHQNWFDNNCHIQSLLKEKHRLQKALLNDPSFASKKRAFNPSKRTTQSELPHMQDTWLTEMDNEIQTYTDRNDLKISYSALKAVYGPTSSGSYPVFTADGNSLISEKEKILERWVEHFHSVLNHQ
ncbi:uncharacterized protein LOC143028848 [Oratosquilla oratoria]|uniref:uncharacterized protein LOC143028848 n=1 Tax=Oratosquilla oratoria TaxID=337810 RepID=UPI003F76DDA4